MSSRQRRPNTIVWPFYRQGSAGLTGRGTDTVAGSVTAVTGTLGTDTSDRVKLLQKQYFHGYAIRVCAWEGTFTGADKAGFDINEAKSCF